MDLLLGNALTLYAPSIEAEDRAHTSQQMQGPQGLVRSLLHPRLTFSGEVG
jgi:hypothetical protein